MLAPRGDPGLSLSLGQVAAASRLSLTEAWISSPVFEAFPSRGAGGGAAALPRRVLSQGS